MRAACKIRVPAPSSGLLRFLRSQIEDTCFFLPNSTISQQHSTPKAKKLLYRTTRSRFPSSIRSFGTSQRSQATVEASFLDLNFLKTSPRSDNPIAQQSTAIPASSSPRDWSRPPIRHASTDDRPLLRRLWQNKGEGHPALKDGDLPPPPNFLDETNGTSLGRSKAGKGANELRLRCTEINENGDVTLVNGEFKKSELIAKVCEAGSGRIS